MLKKMFLKTTKKAEHEKNSLIIIDNEVRGILPDRILLSYFPLPFAGEIDDEQGKELLSLIAKNARQQLLKYVSDQEHSSVQCRQFLSRKRYPAELIDNLIKEFQNKKYIDDFRFLHLPVLLLPSYCHFHKQADSSSKYRDIVSAGLCIAVFAPKLNASNCFLPLQKVLCRVPDFQHG